MNFDQFGFLFTIFNICIAIIFSIYKKPDCVISYNFYTYSISEVECLEPFMNWMALFCILFSIAFGSSIILYPYIWKYQINNRYEDILID